MLEQFTLAQLLAWVFSAAGIAVLLQRIPGWDGVDSRLKVAIVTVLNVAAPFFLAGVMTYVPPAVANQTLDQVIVGLFMAAASFVIHQIDTWLAAQAASAKVHPER